MDSQERRNELLGLAVRGERMLQHRSQTDLAHAAKVSIRTIQKLEAGEATPRVLGRVETALGWEPGKTAAILGQPQPPATRPRTGRLVRVTGETVRVAFVPTVDSAGYLAVTRGGERLSLGHGDVLHLDGILLTGQTIEIDGANYWGRA